MHFADTCNASLTELEKANFDQEPPIFDKSFQKSSESSAVRVIRTTCKALARGANEKSGKFKDFCLYTKAWLKQNGFHSILLEDFHGNRFNILFESAAGVFVMKNHIEQFRNGNQTRKLLKAMLHDIKVPLYTVEVKALGLVSRIVTIPPWCLLEDKSIHILDMNKHYLELINFSYEALHDIHAFMKGNIPPFGDKTAPTRDEILNSLLAVWEHDNKVEVCVNILLPAIQKNFCRALTWWPLGKCHGQ